MKRVISFIGVVACLPLLLTACGSGDSLSSSVNSVAWVSTAQVTVQVEWDNNGSTPFVDTDYYCTLNATAEDGGGYGVIQIQPEDQIAAGQSETDNYQVTITNNDATEVANASDISITECGG